MVFLVLEEKHKFEKKTHKIHSCMTEETLTAISNSLFFFFFEVKNLIATRTCSNDNHWEPHRESIIKITVVSRQIASL